MENSFYSLIFRQKYIKRWGLMRNTSDETLAEHASEVAVITHALATIGNLYFEKSYDVGKAVTLALFHDVPEVYTGDLPTPIKYNSSEMRENYKLIEKKAVDSLLAHLPSDMAELYRPIIDADDDPLYRLVKASDKICAYIKCVDEEKSGNTEFSRAKLSTLEQINAIGMPEVSYFMEHFLPTFSLSLDDMQN